MASLLIESGARSPRRSSQRPTALPARLKCYLGVAILLLADMALRAIMAPFVVLPSALIGMALVVTALVAARLLRPSAAAATHQFFQPAVDWVAHKWLPCFYSPALVTLPLVVRTMPGTMLAGAAGVVAVGVVLTTAFTGHVVMAIRRATATEVEPATHQSRPIVFTRANYLAWGVAAALAALALLLLPHPNAADHHAATSALLLAATVLGFMGGMALPEAAKQVVHPIVACAALPNAAAALLGALTGQGYWAVLQQYLTKGAGGVYGAGDVLFAFLGVIILCFGFKVFEQWDVLCRHAPEVLGASSCSAAFTMVTTAALCRATRLPAELSRGLVARGSTLALALPIAERLGAPLQLAAAAVQLTGIIGGSSVQLLLTAMGFQDAVARGLTAAATAHGLGTAAMAAKEPEAVPFAALAYALCGVSATLLAALPPFRALLLAITG